MNSLLPELKLDIFKCLNFGQVYSMRETNRYFRDFINYYEKELARVKFEKITIVPFCSVDDHLLYSLSAEDFVIEFGGYDFTLSNEKKEKWKSAIDKHFPLYLCSDKPKPIVQPIVHLQIKQVWAYYRDIVLKLPSIPKNIEEMCILRCWFERLFLCFYDEAKFENIVFNPQLIKLLFDNEENIFQKLHTKETYLIYPVHLFELQGMHFVRNHLTVSNNFKIDFFGLQKEENEECNKIIFNIWLNDSARFPYVSVVTSVTFQLFTLLIKYISSSSDSSAVVAQLECQVDWNFTGLDKIPNFVMKEHEMYNVACFPISNKNDPKVYFIAAFVTVKNSKYSIKGFKLSDVINNYSQLSI